ncbi:DUF255 domain-containing protein [Sulfurimonas sp.]|jgi:thioredoxin-related protein|uniref:thioredoxin family protein n=1 Tax=Sulfurimonas sp. TaxID=2022749 RepID=UPI0025FDADAA|nr:DUF255 domain-containing protein [Sulfurimonas sp.]MCK9473243.1 DUF255 domain-containing protein [Sulfurimonas sp.]MDD3506098.1 DUF255 domain-containing protein [Sulfurimonas sp.]
MKKIIFSFMLSCATLFGVDWQSYEEALKLQQKNSKIIMIDVVRTNCRYCINMDRDVFDDKEMSKWIEKRFIPVKLNLDTHEIPLGISVAMTPSFYFVDKNQKIIKNIPGSWNSDDFKDLTKNIKGD